MEELLLKKGNALTNHISMTIKGASISKGALKGMKIALKAFGDGRVPGFAVDAYGVAVEAISHKLFGGIPIPGVILIYRTKVRFEPNFISNALYSNVGAIDIDISAIRGVRKRQLLGTSIITLQLEDGECRIMDGYGILGGGRQIVMAIETAQSRCPPPLPTQAAPSSAAITPPPLPTQGPPPLPGKGPPPLPQGSSE